MKGRGILAMNAPNLSGGWYMAARSTPQAMAYNSTTTAAIFRNLHIPGDFIFRTTILADCSAGRAKIAVRYTLFFSNEQPHEEERVLAISGRIEQALGGWQKPLLE